ncbi:MAG: methyltransferase [Leptospiraceae bacterium]|nr:methyltransferase [Leptospiraceae bacterium]MCP5512692.1 methyltransferase [Leptospiraceae bacterium]
MEKILRLFEPKHYRYLISGIVVFLLNHYSLKFSVQSNSGLDWWEQLLLSSEWALLLSFPIHNYFTFLSGNQKLLKKFIKFILMGNATLLIRILLFFGLYRITNSYILGNTVSVFLIVLLNFILFDRIIFNPESYDENLEDPYRADGTGVETLETIEDARNYNSWLCEKFEDFMGEKNLELGAGRGTLSAILAEKYKIELFEIAEDNHRALNDRFSGNKNVIKIEKDFLKNTDWNTYDCVYSSNVLEHIQDDEFFIEHGMKLLKEGGVFVAIVPAMNLLYSKFDKKIGHIRRYRITDKKRIASYLKNSGTPFRFLKYRFFNPVGAAGWLLKMKILGVEEIKREDAMIMNTLIPYLSVLDYLPLPFGQSILFAIKKEKST